MSTEKKTQPAASGRSSTAASLVRKGFASLRDYGLRTTYRRTVQRFTNRVSARQHQKTPLFTDAELAAQREQRFDTPLTFSIVVPLYNTPDAFLREMIDSVRAQTYGGWELCLADGSDAQHPEVGAICRAYASEDARIRYQKLEKNGGISGNTNAAITMATGDYVGLFDHDDLLHPAALYEMRRTIDRLGADFLYTDEAVFHDRPQNAFVIHFKPDYAPDNLIANNYICHFTVFRRSLLDETGLFDPNCDGSQDHDMILRLTEKAKRCAHIPEVLYYWRAHPGSVAQETGVKPYVFEAGVRAVSGRLKRLGREGEVGLVRPGTTIYRVRYAIRGCPKVSIVISNCGQADKLRACVASIYEKTSWPDFELVLVVNENADPAVAALCDSLAAAHENLRVVKCENANAAAAINRGARACTGDYLLLLGGDTQVLTPDWIEELLMFAQREDVGAVGAKILSPRGAVLHAGLCLGLEGPAGNFFEFAVNSELGYMGRLIYAQDVSAVSGLCLLLRRSLFEEIGGLDEAYAEAFYDVDLCLRLRRAAYLNVWTPFAELSRKLPRFRKERTPEKLESVKADTALFETRWQRELEAGDPYYNPNFTLRIPSFNIDTNVRRHDAR